MSFLYRRRPSIFASPPPADPPRPQMQNRSPMPPDIEYAQGGNQGGMDPLSALDTYQNFSGHGGSGMSNFAGAATPLAYAYMIGKGKTLENERLSEDPDDPLGNFGLATLAPSGAQIAKDPVGMGLPTLFGLPFITPFTASDDAKKEKPEWSSLFGGLF